MKQIKIRLLSDHTFLWGHQEASRSHRGQQHEGSLWWRVLRSIHLQRQVSPWALQTWALVELCLEPGRRRACRRLYGFIWSLWSFRGVIDPVLPWLEQKWRIWARRHSCCECCTLWTSWSVSYDSWLCMQRCVRILVHYSKSRCPSASPHFCHLRSMALA